MGTQRAVLLLSVILCFAVVSSMLVAGTPIVEADSTDSILFSSGAVIFSPLNRTYNSRFLTLNLTFGIGLGIDCSLNYSIDGKHEEPIPLVAKNPTELHVVNEATGLVPLPELSEGSHRLTVYVLCGIYDYHGANPPGAPFAPTSPGSTDYVASWAHTVYFTIDTALQENMVYIRADGSVEGTDKIQRDGDVYTLTGDIAGGIKVERNFTVIDGAGYALQGNGYGTGVNIRWCGTVQNLQIRNFAYGISAVYNNTLIGNYIANCDAGIWIIGGSNNSIKNNTLVNNTNPISICYSSGGGHVITENSLINGTTIIVWLSPQPTVDRNYWSDYNGTDSDGDGIGDTPHTRVAGNETIYIDYHPLMEPVPAIPEFPSWIVLPLFLTATLVAVFYGKRVRARLRHF